MKTFYTNVLAYGNSILYRGISDGARDDVRVADYNPTLFVNGNSNSTWTTIYGKPVEPILPGSIKDCKEFIAKYEGVSGFEIYGNTNWNYQYIAEKYPDEVDFDLSLIKIATLDIEVESEHGFAPIDDPRERINAITLRIGDTKWVFGIHEYELNDVNTISSICDSEEDLLEQFLSRWEEENPDILTGWNVETFDVPYLINRIIRVFSEKMAKRLSPWKLLKPKIVQRWQQEINTYSICGVSVLDYYVLYRKYTFVPQEKYTLDHIANVELGKEKLDYSEYNSIKDFYNQNFQKFVEYNVRDVDLVKELDDKLDLLGLHISIAYTAKINYEDAFSQVRTWDTIIYNHLLKEKKAIPFKKNISKTEKYAGAYVKEPIPGPYKWILSYDVASMYPNTIRLLNISPETLLDKRMTFAVSDLLDKSVDLAGISHTVGANGACYKKDAQGFLSVLSERFYNHRKEAKDKVSVGKKDLKKIENEMKKRGLL